MGKQIKKYSGKKCGKRNNIPKNICTIIEKIENLEFVKHINPGMFKTNKTSPKIDIVGYDHKHKKYFVNIYGGNYVQKFTLDVAKEDSLYEEKIIKTI
jgi:hypothetical protein